jgi:hypothetical protein
MPHPEIDNRTPFAFEPLFIADEDGRPIVAPIVRATFDVDARGQVSLAGEQLPVNFAGELYGEAGQSSYRIEPETAFFKPATDVVLVGHAHAPRRGTTYVDLELRVGPVGKWVRVWGDRHASGSRAGGVTDPAPFEVIPLTFERAFGGWDRTPEDPGHHGCEPRNPVGVGFRTKHGAVREGDPWPNLEDPYDPIRSVGRAGKPAGFGFVSPDWQPRAALAGTYDEAWTASRSPLLPTDFDRRFFNAASEGMVTAEYLHGNEPVLVRQATPEGHWAFHLPGVARPQCRVVTRMGDDRLLDANLDTVIVDADARQVVLLWRSFMPLREGPLDVRAMTVTCANMARPPSSEAVPAGAENA